VLERDAGSLAKDKPVIIRLDSIPEKQFHGVVRQVAALAQPLERNSPLKYFNCDVMIQDAYDDLARIKPGMALKAEVVLDRYDSCFLVPASAVTMKTAQNLVYVLKGERFQERKVSIGAGSHGQAVILDGIEPGEIIALRNPFETRMAHLPDFSKASSSQDNGPQGPQMGGRGGGGRGFMR
jgi:HlyD family secretion protein